MKNHMLRLELITSAIVKDRHPDIKFPIKIHTDPKTVKKIEKCRNLAKLFVNLN